MIRGKIRFEDLNELHSQHSWIPNENMIQVSPEILKEKTQFNEYVLANWMSFRDFILDKYFNYKTDVEDAHRYVVDTVTKSEWMFTKSIFPYDLPEGTEHFVLWNSLYDCSHDFDEELINEIIEDSLKSILESDEFDFVWYVKPRSSIFELWHCTLFQKKCDKNVASPPKIL